MKVKKIKRYRIENKEPILEALYYIITSENKYFESYYSVGKYNISRKVSETRKIDGKYAKHIWYPKNGAITTNYYYLNGKLKKTESINRGAVQQYTKYYYDKNEELRYANSQDDYIYYQKILCNKTNKSILIKYSYFKWSTPIDENIEVKIYEDSLLIRVLEIEDIMVVYNQMEEVFNHYEKFTNVIYQRVNYIDFSGKVHNIQITGAHYETHYEYHANGNVKRKIRYYCTKQDMKETNKQIKLNEDLTFNTQGMLISRTDILGKFEKIEYKYNEEGEWVESRGIKEGELVSFAIRTEEIIDNTV